MKKRLYIYLFLSLYGLYSGQISSSENYSYTKTCLTEDCSKKAEIITYYDGLARPKQVIGINATPSGKDIVTHIEYDSVGRQLKGYLPIPQTGSQNGAVYTSPLSNASAVYGAEKIYSENVMDTFPLNRVKQSYGVGNAWSGKPVDFIYETNIQNEIVKYIVSTSWANNTTSPSLTYSGYYTAGTLLKNSVKDADNNITTEFKNGKGQTLLVRKFSDNGGKTDTYYVYDEYENLIYVLSPLASKANENLTAGSPVPSGTLTNLCYQYRYDTKFRTVEKKIPGKGWEYIVYDKQDRVVMTRDAVAKTKGQWFFTKYDKLGRVLYTGITLGGERAVEQANVYAKGLNNEVRTSAVSFTQNNMPVYYTSSAAYPITFQQVLSVNYYDIYPEGTPQVSSPILNQNVLSQDPVNNLVSTKGLCVASYVKNIEDDNWTKNYLWYDSKGRTIAIHSINHLGGYTKTETKLDFAGTVLQTKAYHKRLNTDTEKVIVQNFEYDNLNRLKKQWHQVDSNLQELLSENTYNELSQLSNKKVGNNLQNINYTYNIKGAVTKVNDPANLNGKLFGYEIKNTNPLNTVAKYNGIITEVDWKASTDNVLRRYSYQYDPLNRLKKGTYSEPNSSVPQNDFFNETMGYDSNSNISSLQRNGKGISGTAELIDNLTYNYAGNRLSSVIDNSGNYAGYPDTSGTAISYDDNGNMTDHKDKGILQIDYNILDLPTSVKFNKTYVPRFTGMEIDYNVKSKYIYRADGVKLKKIYTYGAGKANLESSRITDYLDGFQYEENYSGSLSNPVLKFVPTSEGYYNFENNKYIYSYTDHLGNIRVSYSKNASGSAEVLEENNFYPFGMKHGGYNQTAENPSYNYGYNGKEYQTETGWSDYGARMYMSDIGRWGVIDPLAETSRRFTPYNYAYNNPVMFIDPDGRKAMAPKAPAENLTVPGGMLDYYGRGGTGKLTNLLAFLGQENYFHLADDTMLGGGGGGNGTFGETQAYRDIMGDFYAGRTAGLSNNFGVLSWWTDADGAQYGQYNMMKFATPSDDKWEGGSYGAIKGFSSYLASLIGSTNEEFPIITNPNGMARTDFDASTHDKLRKGDKTFILDWGSFVVPSTFSAPGKNGNITWAGRFYAASWVADRMADAKNILSGTKSDSTLSVYNTWTLDKNGSFKSLDTAKFIKNNDSTGFMRFMNSVDEQRRLKIKNLR
ncbi:RHS repeat-associated protein [Chryseobacterium ginsenosidimutans]|uniref:DUF6443 domain-containing protein n=1 Tax=Chryseobacterium ginsenosidimutans TaxID=687846 RepID=UPI00278A3A6D|nr:DUF6443 domain-containing protein [Chryseobacterium ginsenosidimutans]MDQ0593719.1 RHS repeat-associated protein [Chryseobacterium ginsenosidimutans]